MTKVYGGDACSWWGLDGEQKPVEGSLHGACPSCGGPIVEIGMHGQTREQVLEIFDTQGTAYARRDGIDEGLVRRWNRRTSGPAGICFPQGSVWDAAAGYEVIEAAHPGRKVRIERGEGSLLFYMEGDTPEETDRNRKIVLAQGAEALGNPASAGVH